MSRQPEQGGPIRPPDVGYRVRIVEPHPKAIGYANERNLDPVAVHNAMAKNGRLPAGTTAIPPAPVGYITVTARPTWRLLLAMRLAPPILRWLAAAMVLTLRAFPARVRPAVDVVVTLPSAP